MNSKSHTKINKLADVYEIWYDCERAYGVIISQCATEDDIANTGFGTEASCMLP